MCVYVANFWNDSNVKQETLFAYKHFLSHGLSLYWFHWDTEDNGIKRFESIEMALYLNFLDVILLYISTAS